MKYVFAILIVAAIGYPSGLALEHAVEGDLSKISQYASFEIFKFDTFSFIKTASLSGTVQSIISHANIAVDIGPITIDPTPDGNGEPNFSGDEFYVNAITQCVFHSEESISGSVYYDDSLDDGICIVCKLKGECEDVDATFANLDHGSMIGAINSELVGDGVIVSATNFGSGPDTVIIFDGNTPGDNTENIHPDPDLRVSGICSDCLDLKMLIIPEDVNDAEPDGLVDLPDDDAAGGVMKFQFDRLRKIVSFVFVDHDNVNSNDKARAYSDFACTQLIIGSEVPIPPTQDGEKVTVTMNIDNARCLKIEYHDSGAVTNLLLECVDGSTGGTTLGSGQIDLPEGYEASEPIPIPIDQTISVLDFEGVEIDIVTTMLDFQGLDHGDVLNTQFMADFGLQISGCYNNGITCMNRDPIVFNTNLSVTSDDDLEVDIGNISIIQENTVGCGDGTCDDPDDNASGGEQKFQFNPVRYINSLVFVDADRPEPSGIIFFYTDYDCNDIIDQGNDPNGVPPTQDGGILIPFSGDQTTQVLVPANIEKVGCMEAVYADSGGLSRINLGCPLPGDPLVATIINNYDPNDSEESIYYFDYEYTSEAQKWSPSQTYSGNYFDIISGGDFFAHTGSKVLAGWGNFDPQLSSYNRDALDISGYHDVVLSVWYSYEDTESVDDFYLSYKDGSDWIPIIEVGEFEVEDADVSPVQSEWQNKIVFIPDYIDSLELRFEWSTSSDNEHFMIDNLEILGTQN